MSLTDVRQRIAAAEAKAGRPAGSVELIAVSKVQPADRVALALGEGQRVFGENRVQEAAGRWADWRRDLSDLRLHLLGPLQSNKARQAFGLFDVIQSVDRPKIAATLARLAQEAGRCPDIFVQVNTGAEPQKSGVLPGEADALIAECRDMDLPVVGLMSIPPMDDEASLHFALLAKIARRNGLTGLSMGMSADFEKAIAFGATHVRVGSAVFGARVPAA